MTVFKKSWISVALIVALNASAAENCKPSGPGSFLSGLLQNLRSRLHNHVPTSNLLSLVPKTRRYLNLNATILETFDKWLANKFGEKVTHKTLDRKNRLALEEVFATEQNNVFEQARPKMDQYYRDLVIKRLKIQRTFDDSQTVIFNGREYPVATRLGGMKEGIVYLVRDDSQYVVIKQFHDYGVAQKHQIMFQKLEAKNISVAHVLDIDSENKSLMLTHVEGLTSDDIGEMIRQGLVSKEFKDTFAFKHAVFYNEVMPKVGKSIDTPTGYWVKDSFNPHPNNTAYNPATLQPCNRTMDYF